MKSVIKEIFIILLLCCAICLILGIIFYDYLPTNKVVPSTVEAYKTSNTIKEEINQNSTFSKNETIVLEITDSDLDLYKKDKSYDSGKANPFSTVSENAINNATSSNTVNLGNSNTQTSNPDSTDHFFNSTGLK